ncbi:glycerophosphodiester phosphodiesterase [Herbaspirillum autotrophicum]|uniref:glycerophosphodiester phosphodiesterase n=1 Tax=Herbaspirillum autotrophicum TaxID=180195 RepID=UPI001E490FD3|nr:glycerophosphodiester phosphodiesterase [Herbaspirillum autotrophicum]
MATIPKSKRPSSRVARRLMAAVLLGSMLPAIANAACLGMQVQAHRGSATAAENSLSALRAGYQGGWDGIETDMQQLADGVWVVHHDAITGRVVQTAANLSTHQLNSADWRAARMKNNGQSGNERPPFVSDLLTLADSFPGKTLNAEIKDALPNCGPVQALVAQFRRDMQHGNWFMTSGLPANLRCARAVDRDAYLGLIVFDGRNAEALGSNRVTRMIAAKARAPKLDQAWLLRLQKDIGMPVGVHVDGRTLDANPMLLSDAGMMKMAVFVYSVDGDASLVAAVRRAHQHSGRWPSGVVVDGNADQFCRDVAR